MKKINNLLKVIILIYYFFMLICEIVTYIFKLSIDGFEPITYLPLQICMSVAILVCFLKNKSIDKVYIKSIIAYGVIMNVNLNIYRNSIGIEGVILFATVPAFLIYLSTLIDYTLYKKSNNE